MLSGVLLAGLAGLATGIGGLLVVVNNDFSPVTLTAGMSMAAGVMTYLTFVEIFPEVRKVFDAALLDVVFVNPKVISVTLSGITYFMGWALAELLHYALHYWYSRYPDNTTHSVAHHSQSAESQRCLVGPSITTTGTYSTNEAAAMMGLEIQDTQTEQHSRTMAGISGCKTLEDASNLLARELFHNDHVRICRVGWFTTLALCLHNIPEGIATYTGCQASPKIGLGIALAIALHNIPEGVAVAVPMYFATRSRKAALFTSLLTGLAEPVGAVIAWAFLGPKPSALTFGVVLGLICGTMGNVALKELFFGSARYDPMDKAASSAFVGGMAMMAISLVLLEILAPID